MWPHSDRTMIIIILKSTATSYGNLFQHKVTEFSSKQRHKRPTVCKHFIMAERLKSENQINDKKDRANLKGLQSRFPTLC